MRYHVNGKIFIIAFLTIHTLRISSQEAVSKGFRLAVAQMYVEPGNKEQNLKHAEELITEAAGNGAAVVLLPEAMTLGWTHLSSIHLADSIPGGESCRRMCAAAKKNKVYVCCGIIEKDGAQVYNSAVIIDDMGHVLIKHRKLNELKIAHDVYAQGDRLNVCHTPYGTFGLLICADANSIDHVLTRSLCYMGADVILSPASWAVQPDHDNVKNPYGQLWHDAYIPVAKEFSVWIAGCSNVGPVKEGAWDKWKCIGCSLVIDPSGKEIVQGPYGEKAEKILYVDVRPVARPARGDSWHEHMKTKKVNQ